ncbi:MAG: sodium:solute symporter family protein, partial [Desulfobacterales bacterium]
MEGYNTTWVYIFLGLYIIYCFYWGLKGYFTEKTSSGYAIAGRSIPFFAFLLAATAASFSGWTFIGHPGLIWRDGLAYAFASFYVLTIPITGTFFSKRTWLLGKRYGFITPGDMYAYYFNTEAIRWLVVLTAVLYSIFYSAVQLMASASLFHVITGFPVGWGAIFMAAIVWFYVCTGGLKASTWVGVIQFCLLVGGIVLLGFYVITAPTFGGWKAFSTSVAALDGKLLEVPRVINFGLGGAEGESAWTAVMVLTYMFALMGIQSSPAFTMWTFGIKNPKPLAWQQAFMSTFVVGFALFFFTAFQGMGAKVLQIAGRTGFADINQATVVPILMREFLPPVVLGIVFMGAIAAIHSTAAPYIGTGGSILLRDVYWRYIKKQEASHSEQIWVNRILATLLTIGALAVGLTSQAALVILGALATAFGFVMYVLLLGVIWGVRYPSLGAVLGVLGGMIAVALTYKVWPSPLSMHCAFWGVAVGLAVAFLCKGLGVKDSQETVERQAEVRKWLDSVD